MPPSAAPRFDQPSASVAVISSDAQLTISGVDLPIQPSTNARIVVNDPVTNTVDPSLVVDCGKAYVDFPTLTASAGTNW